MFGAKSSPAVATFILKYHGEQISGEFCEETVLAILKAFYVDDLLACYPTVEKARQVREELQEALRRGGFELAKWKSTHQGVLDAADEAAGVQPVEAKTIDGSSLDETVGKVLGVSYSFALDKFTIRIGEKAQQRAKSRRQMLSLVASVFDPLGFAAPALLKGKIMFQRATADGLGWDETLPTELEDEFETRRAKLQSLENLQIPRWFATPATTNGQAELHVFSDASLEGYGVSAYIRFVNESGESNTSLLFSRAHVVPLDMAKRAIKDQENHSGSIPRLELTAARLAAVVREMLIRELEMTFARVVMWTDSQCVLKWVNDTKTRFTTFIHNRLAKIHELTKPEEWRYIPSELNPADDCSRGLEPEDPKWKRFVDGPEFLKKDESEWPKVKESNNNVQNPICISAITVKRPSDVSCDWAIRVSERVESWSGKNRRIATFTNFFREWRQARKTKSRVSLTKLFPTVVDMKKAESVLVRGIQQKHYAKEIKILKGQAGQAELGLKSSDLTPLDPFIGPDGVLRAGGRLGNSTNIAYDTKFPIILPSHGEEVASLIREEHTRLQHAGPLHTYATLQQRF